MYILRYFDILSLLNDLIKKYTATMIHDKRKNRNLIERYWRYLISIFKFLQWTENITHRNISTLATFSHYSSTKMKVWLACLNLIQMPISSSHPAQLARHLSKFHAVYHTSAYPIPEVLRIIHRTHDISQYN